jgi:hypothetical protein
MRCFSPTVFFAIIVDAGVIDSHVRRQLSPCRVFLSAGHFQLFDYFSAMLADYADTLFLHR